MFKNSLYRFSPLDPMPGKVMPTNIDFIEVNPDKSIVISKSIDFPGKEVFKKTYIIEKLSHIEIALKVLSGELSAKDGMRDLCQNEQLFDEYDAQKFPLGKLLASLLGNKKIRYIDSDMQEKLKEQLGLGNENQGHHLLSLEKLKTQLDQIEQKYQGLGLFAHKPTSALYSIIERSLNINNEFEITTQSTKKPGV